MKNVVWDHTFPVLSSALSPKAVPSPNAETPEDFVFERWVLLPIPTWQLVRVAEFTPAEKRGPASGRTEVFPQMGGEVGPTFDTFPI